MAPTNGKSPPSVAYRGVAVGLAIEYSKSFTRFKNVLSYFALMSLDPIDTPSPDHLLYLPLYPSSTDFYIPQLF